MKISRLFTKTEYAVAFRESKAGLPADLETKFSVLMPNDKEWYADPFIYVYNDTPYIFMEVFDNQKGYGSIGCSKVENGTILNTEIVIDEGTHMSFPFLFEKNGKLYMIPETCAQKKVKVFECKSFPYQWEEIHTLVAGKSFYDSVLFNKDSIDYLFTSVETDDLYGSTLFLMYSDSSTDDSFPYFKESVKLTDNYIFSRQAGNNIYYNNELVRVAQDCSNGDYGHALEFLKIDNLDANNYHETEIARIEPKDLHFKNKIIGKAGVHTYNRCNEYDVVDLKLCTFSISTTLKKIKIIFDTIMKK